MVDPTTPSSDLVDLYRNLWRSSPLTLNEFCERYGLNTGFALKHISNKPKNSNTLFYPLARG